MQSTYITDFNSIEIISASEVNAQMNKSVLLQRGKSLNDLTEYAKN